VHPLDGGMVRRLYEADAVLAEIVFAVELSILGNMIALDHIRQRRPSVVSHYLSGYRNAGARFFVECLDMIMDDGEWRIHYDQYHLPIQLKQA
jgi:hypothetical protein